MNFQTRFKAELEKVIGNVDNVPVQLFSDIREDFDALKLRVEKLEDVDNVTVQLFSEIREDFDALKQRVEKLEAELFAVKSTTENNQ